MSVLREEREKIGSKSENKSKSESERIEIGDRQFEAAMFLKITEQKKQTKQNKTKEKQKKKFITRQDVLRRFWRLH
jgi:hypothetical protein